MTDLPTSFMLIVGMAFTALCVFTGFSLIAIEAYRIVLRQVHASALRAAEAREALRGDFPDAG